MMDTTEKKKSRVGTLATQLVAAIAALYPDPDTGRPGDAAARAALRRAESPAAVQMEPAFHAVLRRMKGDDQGWELPGAQRLSRLALAVSLLAQRRDAHSGTLSFMQALGGSSDADERRLSALRFQALMATLDRENGEEQLTALRRVMPLIADVEFNHFRFVEDLMLWNDKTRIRWTFHYFGSVPPAVAQHSPDAEEMPA